MRRLSFAFILLTCLALCVVLCPHPAAAQGLLPSTFSGWNASASSTPVPLTALDPILGSDATAFREYILKAVEQRSYSQGSQSASIKLYRLRDPSSAYGAYTFLRNDTLTNAAGLGAYASASPDRALFVVGEMLLDVAASPKQPRPSDADLQQLAGLLDKRADHTPYPLIGEHLPERGRIKNSERYVIGPIGLAHFVPLGTDDWMGYDYSAETILAKYRVGSSTETLIVTSYPTQQVAAKKFADILRRFVFDPPGEVPPGQTVLFGKRVSSYVAVVVGAPSRQAADKVLDQVGYESNVTWNEPKQTLTEPGINSMIVEAFVGTGVIMLFAIAAGIGFGGLRVMAKIFLPNKIFDREKQIEILQLGISSKPIKAKDFY
jgi:hypothetical protein